MKKFIRVVDFLKGKKSYIIAGLIGLVTALQFLGVIDNTMAVTLFGLLGGGSVATLRAGMR